MAETKTVKDAEAKVLAVAGAVGNHLDAEEVKKYLSLAQELVNIGVALLPDGKVKDKVVSVQEFLDKPNVAEAVVVGFKVYDDVKVLVEKLVS